MPKVNVTGPREEVYHPSINTTSRSKNWSRGLSPFFVGPVPAQGGLYSKNMENLWQHTKVYKHQIGEDGLPSPAYFKWARQGWADSRAHRYPMGKGVLPEYSWWNGEKLAYIEARKIIYTPLYSQAVAKTEAYAKLVEEYKHNDEIWLWDFDGYDFRRLGMTLQEVADCETRKMGHAFVLAMMLEGII